MRIWRYGVVVKSIKPELFQRTITRLGALCLATDLNEALRRAGLTSAKAEVWSRDKIEEHNVNMFKESEKARVKVYE